MAKYSQRLPRRRSQGTIALPKAARDQCALGRCGPRAGPEEGRLKQSYEGQQKEHPMMNRNGQSRLKGCPEDAINDRLRASMQPEIIPQWADEGHEVAAPERSARRVFMKSLENASEGDSQWPIKQKITPKMQPKIAT